MRSSKISAPRSQWRGECAPLRIRSSSRSRRPPSRRGAVHVAAFNLFGSSSGSAPQGGSSSGSAGGSQSWSTGEGITSALRVQLAHAHAAALARAHDESLLMDFNDTHLAPRPLTNRLAPKSGLSPGLLKDLLRSDRQGLRGLQAFFEFQAEVGSMTLAAGASADPSSASAASSVDGDGGSNLSAGTRQLVKLCTLAGGEPSVAAVLARVVSMAAMVERHLPAGRRVDEAQVLRCLNLVMFDFFHFQAARELKLYNPDSSNVFKVVQERTGGPTALGVIYLAVAEELGLHAEPISLPSHFLVRLRVDGQEVYVDAYEGKVVSLKEVEELLADNLHLPVPKAPEPPRPHRGLASTFPIADHLPPPPAAPSPPAIAADIAGREGSDGGAPGWSPLAPAAEPGGGGAGEREAAGLWFARYLRPATPSEVAMRLLRNMRETYWVPLLRRQITTATHSRLQWHYQQALSVLRYMLLLQPQEEGHVVDLAMCLVGLNRREEAIDAMRAFQRLHPQSANVLRAQFWMESELSALQQVARMERETLQRLAKEKQGPGGVAMDDKVMRKLFDSPDYFARMCANSWNDNFWVSSLLESQYEEEEAKKKKKGNKGDGGNGKGGGGGGGGAGAGGKGK